MSRRSHGMAAQDITIGGLRIRLSSQQVWVADAEVDLNRREFTLLMEFANRRSKYLPVCISSKCFMDGDEGVESNALQVHVHHLRNKLGRDLIKTVRGVGYRLEPANA